MLAGDYTSANHFAPDGFVSVVDADKIRSTQVVSEFKERYGQKFARAIEAEVARVAADREVEAARADMIHSCPQGAIGDLLRAVTAEANKAKLTAPRALPTAANTHSVSIENSHAPPASMPVGALAPAIDAGKIGGQKLSKKQG